MSYPTTIPTFTTKVDGLDYPLAEHINTLQDNLTGVMSELGINFNTRLPDGTMLNGKISPAVVANDLVLTLLTAAGATPSASDPVKVKINGTVRSVTAATTCTLADATNWFNSGGAELATKEIDYFAYAIWDSNSSVVAIAPARIPYGNLVSDFSATTTNEKHLGNYANFTSTDDVINIGRFAATLSAGAGYTWTVPTFTTSNLNQVPTYESRLLTYTTTVASGTGTITSTTQAFKYLRVGRMVFVKGIVNIIDNGTGATYLNISIPVAALASFRETLTGLTIVTASGAFVNTLIGTLQSTTNIRIWNFDGTYPGVTLDSCIFELWYEAG